MYVPSAMVATTMTGAIALGRTWRSIIRELEAPRARAAWTKSFCLMVMTEPRAMREICGQPSRTMNPMTGQTVELVTTESRTRPPSTTGMPKKMSVTRERIASQKPPKKPASPPSAVPTSATPRVAQTPTVTEARAP